MTRDGKAVKSCSPSRQSPEVDPQAVQGDVTRMLAALQRGDDQATEQLLPAVYDALRRLAATKMAQENPGQTLDATALVHEAYLRLVNAQHAQRWDSRGHFYAAAAEAMRRILINRARAKGRVKHGGSRQRINLERLEVAIDTPSEDLIVLDEALDNLAKEDSVCAELVKLRYFAGLTLRDAAKSLGISRRTADRQWAYARAWLFDQLSESTSTDG